MTSSSHLEATTSTISDAHTYYNNAQEQGLDRRNESIILYLRNFNNWIKSILIDEHLKLLRNERPDRRDDIHVFDMGCGKGGDRKKWDVGRVKHVTFSDIAENLVEACKERQRTSGCRYGTTFFPLDCTRGLVRDKVRTTEPCFDLVSSQFVLHYSFDKIESANRFLRNAAELLRVGGYFIGTTVNSCALVERCRKSPDQTISNNVFKVVFDSSINLNTTDTEAIPLFGAKYHFSLDDVVDCPEYLVYFPLLEKLAGNHGLELVDRQTFKDYFDKHAKTSDGKKLLKIMKALERYESSTNDTHARRIDRIQYKHAEKYINENSEKDSNPTRSCRTLSQQEWDITSLYVTFSFKKVRQVKYDDNDHGEPTTQ
ncbi:hypothetical protein I4U23_028263 [Adineta vaga]|nr:hypothetical protein I4U23_028263 [Adineta vaga]